MAAANEAYRDAIQRTLVESLPVAEGVLRPPFAPEDEDEPGPFGISMRETNAFAAQCLTRRLKAIGLV
jgi:ribonucleoside-diphosphate reductase beta chain